MIGLCYFASFGFLQVLCCRLVGHHIQWCLTSLHRCIDWLFGSWSRRCLFLTEGVKPKVNRNKVVLPDALIGGAQALPAVPSFGRGN